LRGGLIGRGSEVAMKAAADSRTTRRNKVPAYVLALEDKLSGYLPEAQVARVRRAYEVGALAHKGQTRQAAASPTSPIRSRWRGILAELGTWTSRPSLPRSCTTPSKTRRCHQAETLLERRLRQKPWLELVDGVTKLDKLHFKPRVRKPPPRASARCCWRWHATCA
jgi:guanosine-3',5'-bis(diphosphate) 3'-pyrophosphohydrolase